MGAGDAYASKIQNISAPGAYFKIFNLKMPYFYDLRQNKTNFYILPGEAPVGPELCVLDPVLQIHCMAT